MSLFGPRPELFNQGELTNVCEVKGIFDVRLGIAGLAPTNGIDLFMPELLAETGARMIANRSLNNYLKIYS